jgi:cell division protein FtsB
LTEEMGRSSLESYGLFSEVKNNLQGFVQSEVIQRATVWLNLFRRKLATLGVGLLAGVLAYHVVFGANGVVVFELKRKEYRQLREQNRSLAQQNEEIEQRIRALKTDPQAIEKEAREHLHYVRAGDVVYTLPLKPSETKPGHK